MNRCLAMVTSAVVAALAAATLVSPSRGVLPTDVVAEVDAAGSRADLAVVVGSTDGPAEAALAAGGSRLVQALARSEADLATARDTLRAKGLYGPATVVRATSLTSLPYADGLVDLIAVGAGVLGDSAPPAAEVTRVLRPGGVALAWRDGAWVRVVNPRAKDLDDWTHFDHDAAGSGQSHDARIGPPTNLQWRVEVQPSATLQSASA